MYYKIAVTDSKFEDIEIMSTSVKTLGAMIEFVEFAAKNYDSRYNISVGFYLDGKLADSFDYKRN